MAAKAHLLEASIMRGKTQSSASSEHSLDEGEGKTVEKNRATRAANAHLTKVRLTKEKRPSSAGSERTPKNVRVPVREKQKLEQHGLRGLTQ